MADALYIKIEAAGTYQKADWQGIYNFFEDNYNPLSLRQFRGSATPPVTRKYTQRHWSGSKDTLGFADLMLLKADNHWSDFTFRFFDNDDVNRFIEVELKCQERHFDFRGALDNRQKILDAYQGFVNSLDGVETAGPIEIPLTPEKQFEQDFAILHSSAQAEHDFNHYVKSSPEDEMKIAIFFVDIDHFKEYNTKYTEIIVDKTILPDAMHLLKNTSLHRGGAYRKGGEEFVVILPNIDRNEASYFCEKLRRRFKERDFKVNGETERLTVSIGVAFWPDDGNTYMEVLQEANNREHKAKESRNRCVSS